MTRHVAPPSVVFSSPAALIAHPTFGVSSCIGLDWIAADGPAVIAEAVDAVGFVVEGGDTLGDAVGIVVLGNAHPVRNAEARRSRFMDEIMANAMRL
jgi:hypothetical protein